MLTVEEFEKGWGSLVVEYRLVENSFMIRAFEAPHKWAKPFFKDKYCARMTSTQRVESANHMLKAYIPRNSAMNKFVAQYNKLLKDRNEAKDSEEHKNRQVKKWSLTYMISSVVLFLYQILIFWCLLYEVQLEGEGWLAYREACPPHLHMCDTSQTYL
jgi:hypothetical protein